MKQRIQWIAALILAASGTLAYACGCGYSGEKQVRLQPVKEMVVERHLYTVQKPLIVSESTCLMEPKRSWTPFLGFSPSERFIEPVGEKITTVTTYSKVTSHKWTKKHLNKKVTLHSKTMLLPVGEKFTTVKYIHRKTLLMPVGERLTTVKVTRSNLLLEPIGERISTVRYFNAQPVLLPSVGERITTVRYLKMKPILEPIGERTIIRTTRIYNNCWSSCF